MYHEYILEGLRLDLLIIEAIRGNGASCSITTLIKLFKIEFLVCLFGWICSKIFILCGNNFLKLAPYIILDDCLRAMIFELNPELFKLDLRKK
jgi:5'(3')-deoxyribonucleotidase